MDATSDKKPRSKLTVALLDARTTTQPESSQKLKAKDDNDITMDLGAPRFESGKYWKEQYESYAERSEKEMKKVIAKQQLAKKFAMKKDGEVTELVTKLEQERKRFRQREMELENQNKDYQERLRQALAENTSANIEVAALKARIANLEKSIAMPSSEVQQSKVSFQIYEDSSREPISNRLEHKQDVEPPFAPSFSMASSGKENSSPKVQQKPGQTISKSAAKFNALPEIGAREGGTSFIWGKSPRILPPNPKTTSRITSKPASATLLSEKPPQSPSNIHKPDLVNGKPTLKSPDKPIPSSPLPMPSPDPWLDMHESSLTRMDKMAMPGYSGEPYSRPEWNPPPRQHRTAKSMSIARLRGTSKAERPKNDKASLAAEKAESRADRSIVNGSQVRHISTQPQSTIGDISSIKIQKAESLKQPEPAVGQAPVDQKFDVLKTSSHHVEGSSQVKRDKVELSAVDRKELARRRLEEKKKLRKNGF